MVKNVQVSKSRFCVPYMRGRLSVKNLLLKMKHCPKHFSLMFWNMDSSAIIGTDQIFQWIGPNPSRDGGY